MGTSLLLVILIPASLVAGYFIRRFQAQKQTENAEALAKKMIEESKAKSKEIILEAKDETMKTREQVKVEEKERRDKIGQTEERLAKREEVVDKKIEDLDKRRTDLQDKERDIDRTKKDLFELRKKQEDKLEKIAKLSREEARKVLLELTEREFKDDLLRKIKSLEESAKEEADKKAQEIVALAIQRCAVDLTAEFTVTTVNLPSDEMKGRIIGREGRNIHSLEEATGCDIIVDDTPEAVVISGFDPVRRQVARVALEKLMGDGRIHPTKIEEAVEKAKNEINQSMKEAGEQAVFEVGIAGLPQDLTKILGRLKFRTSYGQNVLRHSVEVAHLAGLLASEIGADVNVAKKAGLLHDIGKAVDHEVQGNHAMISRDIARKFGLSEEVIHGIEAHHEEVEPHTVEAIIVHVADAISSSRPGARRETLDTYIKRLKELENIANGFEGVEKSFAIQAGREIRIVVKPEEIDDLKAEKLSHRIARKIEEDLKYPGQIKVNVIRETRAVDFAK